MVKFLVVQTAFIGDVILATPIIEKLNKDFPGSRIDFLLRKGNEGLLENHPFLGKIYVWNKKDQKYKGLYSILKEVRREKYDYVINLQRFLATGLFTALSLGKQKIGFTKNPLSFGYDKKYPHLIDEKEPKTHEIDRNLLLISEIVKAQERVMPKLYPTVSDLAQSPKNLFVTMSPTSVWFTKQYPAKYWSEMIMQVPVQYDVYLLGGKSDFDACEVIRVSSGDRTNVFNMAGKLSFLESAAYMKNAKMNYVNDSAPLHITSSMEAAVTAIFCSTTPKFGFGPLQSDARIAEANPQPPCKPCGLHGYKACPLGHFKCADIDPSLVIGNI